MTADQDFTNKDVYNFKTVLTFIKRLSSNGINASNAEMITKLLDGVIDFQSYLYHEQEFPKIHRLTINKKILGSNKRITDIRQLKYPPKEYVKSFGRCNQPGQSMLYASYGMLSILSEMKPELGDLITISTWKSIENATLTFCPIFRNQPPDGTINVTSYQYNKEFNRILKDFPPNKAAKVDLLTQFIADAFSKRFRHNSNDMNYLISAYFADIMLNKYQNNAVEAIFYPSVQQKLAFENLAIKPDVFDAKYKLISVSENIVVKTPRDGDGGHFQEGISKCEAFNFETNEILWDNKYYQSNDKMDMYRKMGYEL
nr:hypothetical protein [Pedobacter panaciterrae]